VKGWTLAELIDEDQYHLLLQEAERELATFVQPDGSVEFDAPALIMTACKANPSDRANNRPESRGLLR
jgi:hypothetical protein